MKRNILMRMLEYIIATAIGLAFVWLVISPIAGSIGRSLNSSAEMITASQKG